MNHQIRDVKLTSLTKIVVLITVVAAILGCIGQSDYDTNKEVPTGEYKKTEKR